MLPWPRHTINDGHVKCFILKRYLLILYIFIIRRFLPRLLAHAYCSVSRFPFVSPAKSRFSFPFFIYPAAKWKMFPLPHATPHSAPSRFPASIHAAFRYDSAKRDAWIVGWGRRQHTDAEDYAQPHAAISRRLSATAASTLLANTERIRDYLNRVCEVPERRDISGFLLAYYLPDKRVSSSAFRWQIMRPVLSPQWIGEHKHHEPPHECLSLRQARQITTINYIRILHGQDRR